MSFGSAVEVASLYAKLGADVGDFNSAMKRADSVFGKLSAGVGVFAKAGVGAALAGVGALGAGFGVATKQGMEFEKTMSGAGAVLQANGETMGLLSDLALRIGKDTAFGASEAALAIEMLAKNGLNAEQILGGAADATVALAAATGADLATAADIATDAMAQFGLGAGNLNAAINGISGVVVASKFGINDYAMALGQAGGVAGQLGVSFEDFNAVIAATSSSFSGGSDAGTSFKTFLQRLPGVSGPARDALAELGILTADGSNQFFDAAGNMKGMAEIAGILQRSLAGLNDETKTRLLSDAFGTDAIRTALGLASAGEAGINAMLGQIAGVDASSQAMQRLDNLAGDVEQLSGSFETLGITVQRAFNPLQRRAVQFFTGQINELIEWDWDAVARRVERVFDVFDNPGARRALADLVAGVRAFGVMAVRALEPVVGAFRGLWAQVAALSGQGLGAWLGALNTGWQQVLAWAQGTALPWLWAAVQGWGAALWGWVEPQIPNVLGALGRLWEGLASWVVDPGKRSTLVGQLALWAGAFATWAGALWADHVWPGLGALWAGLASWVVDPTKRSQLVGWLSDKWSGFREWAGDLLREDVGPRLGEMWKGLVDWVKDPQRRQEVLSELQRVWTGFGEWAGQQWGLVRPKMVEFLGDVNDWIDANHPDLAGWRDVFATFFEGVGKQFRDELPAIQQRWVEFTAKLGEELTRIGEAFGLTFGPQGSAAGFGQFFVRLLITLGDVFLTLVESMLIKLRVLAESFGAIWRIGEGLLAGDMGAQWEAIQQLGAAIAGFGDVWRVWGDLINRVEDRFANPGAPIGGGGRSAPVDVGVSGGQGLYIERIEVVVEAGTDVGQARALADEIAARIWRQVEYAGGRI